MAGMAAGPTSARALAAASGMDISLALNSPVSVAMAPGPVFPRAMIAASRTNTLSSLICSVRAALAAGPISPRAVMASILTCLSQSFARVAHWLRASPG